MGGSPTLRARTRTGRGLHDRAVRRRRWDPGPARPDAAARYTGAGAGRAGRTRLLLGRQAPARLHGDQPRPVRSSRLPGARSRSELMAAEKVAFDEWCIVEQLGHRRLAGRVQEFQLAGAGFLRLDVPETAAGPGRSQFLAPASIFALHPVDEETAKRVAALCRPEPVQAWELPAIA